MIQPLNDKNHSNLDNLIAKTEKKTGIQIVLAVIKRSDSYTELPWIAFAIGAGISGLLVFILNFSLNHWSSEVTVLTGVAATLAGGVVLAILTLFIPGFARRFLTYDRADVEVRQYAQALFLERELFATKNRTGILLLVSEFERKVVILPDKGLDKRLTEADLMKVIASMKPQLRKKDFQGALVTGLERLYLVLGQGEKGSGKNELPDDIIEEKGV